MSPKRQAIMNMNAKMVLLAGIIAACGAALAAPLVTVIPEGGTLYVGGSGADPYNKQGSFIIFNPGSTLVVTQTAARTVWATLVATNGAATLRYESGSATCCINSHVFARGAGSLNVTGTKAVTIGHNIYQPVLDIRNMTIEDKSGRGLVLVRCTALSLPESSNYEPDGDSLIWLCGASDMFPDGEDAVLTQGRWVLASESAVPVSKTVRVKSPATLMLAPRNVPDTSDIVANYPQDITAVYSSSLNVVATNRNSIAMESVADEMPHLVFTNKTDFTFAGSLSGTGVVEVTGYNASYDSVTAITVGLTGDSSSFQGTIAVGKPFVNLFLGHANAMGGARIMPATSGTKITGVDGVSASIDTGSEGRAVTLADAGTFTFVGEDKTFTNSVTHWFDFSRADMYRYPGEGTTTDYMNEKLDNKYPFVERVLDWRDSALTSLWNRRLYVNATTLEFVSSVYPCRKSDTFAGETLSYLAIPSDANRRLPLSEGEGSGYVSFKSVSAQMVIMVFGSQNGGGRALIGTDKGVLARSGNTTNDGITTNTSHSVWVDGVEVDPTAPNTLNGGWQVISIGLDGEKFNALGWVEKVAAPYGGQNYGEILVFSDPVTERQRIEAEIYLADKWGLSGQYAAAARTRYDMLVHQSLTNKVTISGAVTVNADENALCLDGTCVGSVVLSGGVLLANKSPWTASDIPSEGRIFWLDANDRSTLSSRGDVESVPINGRTNEIYAVCDKESKSFVAGKPVLYGVDRRKPTWYETSFGGGPVRGWLDFNQYYNQWPEFNPSADSAGNMLRFYEYADDFNILTGKRTSTGAAPAIATISTRTAFVAQNSAHGGGTPLLDNINGDGEIRQRKEGPQQSIWRHGPAVYSNGVNRLNGVDINPQNGYTGKPEVFSVRGTSSVNTPYVDCYGHSENTSYEDGKAAIIGEMLWYSTALDDDTMAGIESYLMRKWLDAVPPGLSDVARVTVSGTGSIVAADAQSVPRLNASFEGNVAVSGAKTFEIMIDSETGSVAGALNVPEAVLDLPSPCKINVDFTTPVGNVDTSAAYTLVSGAAMAHPVEWVVQCGANVPRRLKIVKTTTSVVLKSVPTGMLLIIR